MPTYTPSQPKAGGGKLPPGKYKAEIIGAEEKISSKGNPMIELSVEIQLPSGHAGPSIREYLVFSEKASWKVDEVLASCGIAVVEGEPLDVTPELLIGQVGYVETEDETTDRGTFARIARWLHGKEKDAFVGTAKQNAHIKAKADGYAPKAKDLDGDDIPF